MQPMRETNTLAPMEGDLPWSVSKTDGDCTYRVLTLSLNGVEEGVLSLLFLGLPSSVSLVCFDHLV